MQRYRNNGLVAAFIFGLLFSCKTSNAPVVDGESAIGAAMTESKGIREVLATPDPNPDLGKLEMKMQGYRETPERKFDLIHTSLDLSFDYANQRVHGTALLRMKPYFFEQSQVSLDAKDFEIHDSWLVNGQEQRPLNFRYDGKRVDLFLPGNYSSSDTLLIGLRYTAKPEETTQAGGRAVTDTKGLYFINPTGTEDKPRQIWTQGETSFSSKWFPTIDHPNERQTHDIRFRIDSADLTISNGRLLSQTSHADGTRTDHWEMDLPHAPYLTAVAVGDFAKVSDKWRDVEVNYYVERGFEKGAARVFQHTPEMLTFFSELLGVDYPWQKYDQVVVRDFVSGAMENTTVSIFMESLNLDEREALDSDWDYIIAHELFHQWFGNLVTTESWSNLPLNESFADYSEYLWFEYKEGKDKADMHHLAAMEQYLDESLEKQVDLIRFHYEHEDDMFDSHSYAKGGRVLHMLRRHLGDEAFFASLRHYLTKHAYSSVEIHDLRLAFEQVTGRDLNWFFNQWFLASGHPILDIKLDTRNPESYLLTISQKQDFQTTPLYRIPFKVNLYKDGGVEEREFVLEQGTQQFALENGAAVDAVIVDEDMVLLAEKRSYRGAEAFKRQFTFAKSGVARLEALDSLTAAFLDVEDRKPLILEALEDSFSEVRGLALTRMPQAMSQEQVDEALSAKILRLAEEDPSHEVRASAIGLLGELDGERYAGVFQRLVQNPSYVVAGAALTAMMDRPGGVEAKMRMFETLKEERNIRMVVPLADFLTSEAKVGYDYWFNSKLDAMTGESLYYFIGYYGDYFASVQGSDKAGAINRLMGLAGGHPANYIRLTAFQSLFGFIDEEGVLEQVVKIHAEESDELVRNYQQFFLEPYLEEN
ncbi:MAG: M1 family metallopeptidase [Lunatimonas sp.]|uniref:M1 family metallopeptidase n=1 Tax=Lunatimonas sp. TaxID=2060141 RepID=UPI00263BB4A2|nr:M1 family metallopeptidase [Lunatimonas sp.]MCC5939828.1 M1 family metallopeptidase [Lunatimonas sp.]